MQWIGRRGSGNVEDGRSGGGFGGFGGGRLGIVGLLVVLAISFFTGQNPLQLLSQVQSNGPAASQVASGPPAEADSAARFVSVVLADTEEIWGKLFAERGQTYAPPKLRLFRGQVQSGCGGATDATGPFYCPADQRIYIDLSFYDDLHRKYGAPGDFAMAYVIAHEVGHHIQHLLGTTRLADEARARGTDAGPTGASVRLELQADYYAGVWAHYEEHLLGVLDPGDVQEAMQAAAAVGDDRLQQQAQGQVVPDAFTHGTSAQRQRWFMQGYQSGDPAGGDTFGSKAL